MDALGLLKGTSETVLAPEAVCTIEKAVEVAEKSTHAQQLGWYQARRLGRGLRTGIFRSCAYHTRAWRKYQ
ncbi:MAG: hypothetical protein L6V35_04975 [Alistipes putredinis]|nr:MAG: hypothetical protein L6V35_04975 [Alistipes putredinis]